MQQREGERRSRAWKDGGRIVRAQGEALTFDRRTCHSVTSGLSWASGGGVGVAGIKDGPCLLKASKQRAALMLGCSWCLFSFVVLETSEKSNLNIPA